MTTYNIPVTPGTGATVATDSVTDAALGSSVSVQYVKLMDGSSGGNTRAVVGANGLKVDGSGVTQPISGTVTLSSNPTVIPSSVFTVTLSSNPTTIASSAVTVNQGTSPWTVVNSSVPTVTLSSNPTVIPSSAVSVIISSLSVVQSSLFNVSVSSGTVTLSSNPTVIPSSVVTVTLSSNPTVIPSSVFTVTLSSNPTTIASSAITVNQGSPPWLIGGDVTAGSADSGNPVKVGGIAQAAQPVTSVSSGQRVNALFDKVGKFITAGAIRTLKGVTRTSITSTTETTIISAGAANVFNDVYSLVLANESSVSTFLDFRDSSGGTIRMSIYTPTNDTRGFAVSVDSAMVQSGTSAAWTATSNSSVATIIVTALYVSNI